MNKFSIIFFKIYELFIVDGYSLNFCNFSERLSLLTEIEKMFAETRCTETILGPVIQAGLDALKVIFYFHISNSCFNFEIFIGYRNFSVLIELGNYLFSTLTFLYLMHLGNLKLELSKIVEKIVEKEKANILIYLLTFE